MESRVSAAIRRLEAVQDRITDTLKPPGPSPLTPGQRYAKALDIARLGIFDALVILRQGERVDVERDEPPLQAVLAEIVAEGHEYRLCGPHYPRPQDGARIATKLLDSPSFEGESVQEHQAWASETEDGWLDAATPLAAAQGRLADLRRLHVEKPIPEPQPAGEGDGAPEMPPGLARRIVESNNEPAGAAKPSRSVVHFALLHPKRIVCTAPEGRPAVTMPDQGVSCPLCRRWIKEHLSGWEDREIPEPQEGER